MKDAEVYDILRLFLTDGSHDIQPFMWKNQSIPSEQSLTYFKSRAMHLTKHVDNIESKSIIDLGSNIGLDSMILAKYHNCRNITAIDYKPLCILFLRFLLAQNSLSERVTAAVGNYSNYISETQPIYDVALMYHLFRNPSPGVIPHWVARAREIWIDFSPSFEDQSYEERKALQQSDLSGVYTYIKNCLPKTSSLDIYEFEYSWMLRIKNAIS